ncbi:VanZ family protein [bacterium]|nr:VanZ family protein [bacterium]
MIFALSSVSFEPLPAAPGFLESTGIDKVAHLIMFGVLGWLCARALHRAEGFCVVAAILIALVFTSVYGATDEWHQVYVPGRYPSGADWIADTAGACVAAWFYLRTQRAAISHREGVAPAEPIAAPRPSPEPQ